MNPIELQAKDNELPGMLAIAQGVKAQTWPHTMDAAVWAQEFRATQLKLGQEPLDEGWMIAWFANAIMAGFDTAQSRHSAALTDAYAQGGRDKVDQMIGKMAADGVPTYKLEYDLEGLGDYRLHKFCLAADVDALLDRLRGGS